MPKILAIETSSAACSIALLNDEAIAYEHMILNHQQAQLILPLVDKLLTAAGVTLNQLDALAIGCGPGSFTGVRIGVSVAQALAYALKIPVIPLSSLAILAQGAYKAGGGEKILVAIDARMQEIYWGKYIIKEGLAVLSGEETVTSPHLLSKPAENDWFGVGNGWAIYQDKLAYLPVNLDVISLPHAKDMLDFAKVRFVVQDWIGAEELTPVYIRNNVAEKGK